MWLQVASLLGWTPFVGAWVSIRIFLHALALGARRLQSRTEEKRRFEVRAVSYYFRDPDNLPGDY